jgi:hypothetical protein
MPFNEGVFCELPRIYKTIAYQRNGHHIKVTEDVLVRLDGFAGRLQCLCEHRHQATDRMAGVSRGIQWRDYEVRGSPFSIDEVELAD